MSLRVAVVPSWYPPDGGWFFRDQCADLRDLGLEVDVLYVRPRWIRQVMAEPASLRRLWRQTSGIEDGLRVWRLEVLLPSRFHRADHRLLGLATVQLMRRYIADVGRPDLVHAHSTVWAGYGAWRVRQRFDLPYVVTEHRGRFALPADAAGELIPSWWQPHVAAALEHAGAVVAVGSKLAEGLTRYSRRRVPVAVIPNGIDTTFFRLAQAGHTGQQVDTREEPHKGNGSGTVFTFVFVGTLTRQKGVHILLEAFEALHRDYEKVRLVLVGSGPERVWLDEYIAQHNLGGAVELCGQLPALGVRSALHNGDVLVLPSQWEGFGVALIEALAAGLPIIATTGSPPEVCPGEVGLRVPFGDVERLQEAMEFMLRNRERYDAQALHAYAVEHFDSRRVAAQVANLYERVLARPR